MPRARHSSDECQPNDTCGSVDFNLAKEIEDLELNPVQIDDCFSL